MRFDLTDLSLFRHVVEAGSITHGAERAHLALAAASTRIRQMEQVLGAALLVRSRGMGLLLISHNLHLVSSFCDRVLVMYAGQVLETCAAGKLSEATHPYTRGLLAALPRLGDRRTELPQLQRDPAWMADLA